MDRIERFLSDLTTHEKGYRVVGDPASQTPHQTSWPSKKLGRVAISTVLILALGFTAYSFSPTAVASFDNLRNGSPPPPEQHPAPKPGAATENLEPVAPPEVDWSFIGKQKTTKKPGSPAAAPLPPPPQPDTPHPEAPHPEAPHPEAPQPDAPNPVAAEPPTETTPIPPSESDYYGVAPSETPHVPGPEPHSPNPEEYPSSDGGPVPEANLEAQSEEDFYGESAEKPSVAEAESKPQNVDYGQWGAPQPEDWEEPTPPEWEDASLEPENMEEAYKASSESMGSEGQEEEDDEVADSLELPYVVAEEDAVTAREA